MGLPLRQCERGSAPVFGGPLMSTTIRCSPWVVLLVLAGWAGSSGTAVAQIPRDVMLTYQARHFLDQDEVLANHNIGVKVRDGVATLFGNLPSSDLIQRAENRLRAMKGLRQVQCELQVKVPTETPGLRIAGERPLETPRRTETVSLLAPILDAEGNGKPAPPAAIIAALTHSEDVQDPGPPRRSREDAMLAAAVEELRWTDPRF